MKYEKFCVMIVYLVAANQEFQPEFFEKMKFRKRSLTFTKAVGFLKFVSIKQNNFRVAQK